MIEWLLRSVVKCAGVDDVSEATEVDCPVVCVVKYAVVGVVTVVVVVGSLVVKVGAVYSKKTTNANVKVNLIIKIRFNSCTGCYNNVLQVYVSLFKLSKLCCFRTVQYLCLRTVQYLYIRTMRYLHISSKISLNYKSNTGLH